MARKYPRRALKRVVPWKAISWMAILLGIGTLIAAFVLWLPEPLPAHLPAETASATPTATASSSLTPLYSDPPVPASPTASTPAPSASTPAPLCNGVVGTPQHVTVAAMGVDADIEVLKADPMQNGIGDPDNKLKMGWQAKFPGVKPGACKGTILMDAHTYHDGSAVFKVSYNGVPMAQLDKLGMIAVVATDKGNYYYKIDWQKTVTVEQYPDYAKSADIYDVGQQREETLFFATCSGWNGVRFPTETMFSGHRIQPPQ